MIPDPKRIEADAKHGQATGLLIPESTPGPNTSRFEADNARRQVESAKAASSEVKPGITSNEGSATVSGRKGKGREVPDTSPQTSAVQRVLDCGPTQYYQILGVKDPSTKEEFKKAYSKLYRTLHPDKNKKKGARDAFGRVHEAATALTVDMESFAENACEPEEEGKYEGPMESLQIEAPRPDAFRLKMYRRAENPLTILLDDPKNVSSRAELHVLNTEIVTQNVKI